MTAEMIQVSGLLPGVISQVWPQLDVQGLDMSLHSGQHKPCSLCSFYFVQHHFTYGGLCIIQLPSKRRLPQTSLDDS